MFVYIRNQMKKISKVILSFSPFVEYHICKGSALTRVMLIRRRLIDILKIEYHISKIPFFPASSLFSQPRIPMS